VFDDNAEKLIQVGHLVNDELRLRAKDSFSLYRDHLSAFVNRHSGT
jgi:hypothetical protein